jgi:hypothetical protein
VAEAADPGPLDAFVVMLQQAVGELLVTGLDRADHVTARRWRDLTTHGESLGGDAPGRPGRGRPRHVSPGLHPPPPRKEVWARTPRWPAQAAERDRK